MSHAQTVLTVAVIEIILKGKIRIKELWKTKKEHVTTKLYKQSN